MAANDNWTNPSKLAKMPAALIFYLLNTWPISVKHGRSGYDWTTSESQIFRPHFCFLYILLLPGHSFSKIKSKYQLFLSTCTICRRNYDQHTYSSLIGDTKNSLEDIKNLLGLSGFDPVNSTVIHILSKTKLSKTIICTHIHQMPLSKMKNSQSEHLTWLANRNGLMNLDMTSVVHGRMPEETCLLKNPIHNIHDFNTHPNTTVKEKKIQTHQRVLHDQGFNYPPK